MPNISKLNTKLQYEEFSYKLNKFLINHDLIPVSINDLAELNNLFKNDFEKYVNIIVYNCMIYNHSLPEDIGDEFYNFIQDNFDIIDFDNIDKNSFSQNFFMRYIFNNNILNLNFKMFLYTVKFGYFGEQVLEEYLDLFIKYGILTNKQLDKIFMFIAAYHVDISSNFISKYIKYFSTPRNAYIVKTHCKHFYDCSNYIVDKLKALATKHVYGYEEN